MGEIAQAMMSGELCNKCGVVIDIKDTESGGFPINCDSCHEGHIMKAYGGIYSEKFHRKMKRDKDPIMSGMIFISYNAEIQGVKFNDKQLKFFSSFLHQVMMEED